MGRSVGLIVLVVGLAVGGYFYTRQIQEITPGGAAPTTTVDITVVRMDLLALAIAERLHFATNSKYASLEELRTSGDTHLTRNNRPNFTYSAETSDNGFRIIATYSGADPNAPKRISIDETLAIKTESR